mgnify:CR=1 FL=1
MYVLFCVESREFVLSVVPDEPLPLLYWGREITPLAIIPSLDDAIFMAGEVQRVHYSEDLYHYSIQVLELGPNNIPRFNTPAFEIPARRGRSVN